jgi:hypothetical protein
MRWEDFSGLFHKYSDIQPTLSHKVNITRRAGSLTGKQNNKPKNATKLPYSLKFIDWLYII